MAKVLIAGGGFAGVVAAESLAKKLGNEHEITLVSRSRKFLFYPALVRLAFGQCEPMTLRSINARRWLIGGSASSKAKLLEFIRPTANIVQFLASNIYAGSARLLISVSGLKVVKALPAQCCPANASSAASSGMIS